MKVASVFLAIFLIIAIGAVSFAGEVVFDISHRVIFPPSSEAPLGLKRFVSLFEREGHRVLISEKKIVTEDLRGVASLVLPGPMKPYSKAEIEIIRKYVKGGGNVLILLHISKPLYRIAEVFDILLSSAVISESTNLISGESQDFYVRDISQHPLMEGVTSLAFYGTWGLHPLKGAKVIAATTDKAWLDFNRNRIHDKGEPVRSVGVVAVSDYGKGRVAVVADDAPLANAFLDKAGNLRFAENLVAWLAD